MAADLWAIAECDPELGGMEAVQLENGSTVLFVGDSGCGKSSLIQAFLKPNSSKDPKPTFALEYNFARRKNAGSSGAQGGGGAAGGANAAPAGRAVAHLWELGGDVYEPKLLEIPISPNNITTSSVIIVCDLSKPKNVFASLKRWVSLVRDVIQRRLKALAESGAEGASTVAALKDAAAQAYGTAHVDLPRVRPCEVPLVIIGNKSDALKSVASADRRLLIQVMRFVAHYHGATLLFTSSFERDAYRAVFSSVCFGLPIKPALDLGADKPVCVTAGKDDFAAILLGTAADGSSTESKSRLAYSEADVANFVSAHGVTRDSWGRFGDVLAQSFGAPDPEPVAAAAAVGQQQGESKEEGLQGGSAADNTHPELEVDEARAARDAALFRYMEEVARKEALNSRLAAPGGGGGTRGGQQALGDDGGEAAEEAKAGRRRK